MTNKLEHFEEIAKQCRIAMTVAMQSPGPHGGVYVGRWPNGSLEIMTDSIGEGIHPEPPRWPEDFDVIAHVTPERVAGIGHARYWLNEDGTLDYSYFGDD